MNKDFEEFNDPPKNEFNDLTFENQSQSFDEQTDVIEDNSETKTTKTNNPKLIQFSKLFLFLAFALALIFPGLYIPVISNIIFPSPTPKAPTEYVTKINFNLSVSDTTYRYLQINLSIDDKSNIMQNIFIALYDTDDNYLDYSIQYMPLTDSNWASYSIPIKTPVKNYTFKVYCSCTDPSKLEYTNQIVYDEITYYLIYTYDKTISF